MALVVKIVMVLGVMVTGEEEGDMMNVGGAGMIVEGLVCGAFDVRVGEVDVV